MYKPIDFTILRSRSSLYIFFLSVRNTRNNRLNEECCVWMRRKRVRGSYLLAQTRARAHESEKENRDGEQQRRESAGNRAVSAPFPWKLSTSRGPAGLSSCFSTSRSAARVRVPEKKKKKRELSDSENGRETEKSQIFLDKLENYSQLFPDKIKN